MRRKDGQGLGEVGVKEESEDGNCTKCDSWKTVNNEHFILSIRVLRVTGIWSESSPLKAVGKTLWASNITRREKKTDREGQEEGSTTDTD